MTDGVTVAVTDHAAERFRQRGGSRRGGFDVKPEIAGRVSEAWGAGRVSETPPPGASEAAARGSVYIRDPRRPPRSADYGATTDGTATSTVPASWAV